MRPTVAQAWKLAAEIDRASEAAGLTHSELHEHLATRVAKARTNPFSYAVNALSDDRLPLPGVDEQDDRQIPETPRQAEQQGTSETQHPVSTAQQLPACGTCRTLAGQPKQVRVFLSDPLDADSAEFPCPDCHPDAQDT